MDNTDYIESYFTNELVPDQAREFEKRIESDPGFAEEVAFYLSALTVSREVGQTEKKEHFKKLYQENSTAYQIPVRNISTKYPFRKLAYYITAAAAIVGIVFGTYIFTGFASPQQLASQYEKDHLQTLDVTMGGQMDSIQTGRNIYNSGKPAEALLYFEKIIHSDSSNSTAKKYAGLSALKLKEYDKALAWFKELETYSQDFANPGLLYEALTLMDRDQPGDKAKAKLLLHQIINNDLEGKETAQKWLKKMN
jgi:tetratricopeptide (TPR) repeat protein